MTDNDLENLYKTNLSESHFAGLRGVFDAGYAIGAGAQQTIDQSQSASAATATTDDPTITTA